MDTLLQDLLNWISLHPHAFIIAVYIIALMESLVVLGLLIPGAALLFGAGALIATGALPIAPIMLSASAGAITGDFISFLLGQHYQQRLRVIWPFRRYPRLVNRGVNFFVQHGGKSVFMARFIGPLRPIVPAIAGMMNMTTSRFLLVVVTASLLWSPVYILPGMVFGASLGLAAEVAGRLVVLLVVLAGIAWLGFWLISTLIRLLQPHIATALEKILERSRSHPMIKPLAGSLLDPNHPEARGLAILSVLFFITLWVILLTSRQVLHGHWFDGIDSYIFHSLQDLRTPWISNAMVFVTQFGSKKLLAFILVGGSAWLLWKRYNKAAWHWLAVYTLTGLLTWVLKNTVQIARPPGIESGYSFPSAHTSMSLAVYGFLALMIARELPVQRRWIPYSIAGLLITLIAMSRLYLGVHWFSDVLAGFSLGLAWVALIGIAYDRHPAPPLPVKHLLIVTLLLLTIAGSWYTHRNYTQELAHYSPQTEIHRITLSTWKTIGWEQLPIYRMDIEGVSVQPMNFQWAGSLDSLQAELNQHGWKPATPVSPMNAMNWLAPAPGISTLPILPQVNDGQHQELLLVAPHSAADSYLTVIRLWPSNHELVSGNAPVWVGNVSKLYIERTIPLIAYLRTAPDFDGPMQQLYAVLRWLPGIATAHRNRNITKENPRWSGDVLLAWETGIRGGE
jgi:membrane protein DedA with SNARE-associated domain/membrane-associated phospholipid phosphatase